MAPTKTRKEIEFETRRQVIVDATRRLLAERDIEATSMDDIAEAAEYTRRTLYSYFNSRDEILLLVLIEDLVRRWKMQQFALRSAGTGLEKIQTWARALYEYSSAHPHSIRLQAYWDYRGIDERKIGPSALKEFELLNNELADGLRTIFSAGLADGSLRPEIDLDLCISQFLYTLRIVIHRALSPAYSFATFNPDIYVEHYLHLFCRAIESEKTSDEQT